MAITRRGLADERLMDLERMVARLTGRLRELQWELQQAKGSWVTERLWKNFMGSRQATLISTVCNRRIRPNTKVVSDVGATTKH
jgi:hypothetical protein